MLENWLGQSSCLSTIKVSKYIVRSFVRTLVDGVMMFN